MNQTQQEQQERRQQEQRERRQQREQQEQLNRNIARAVNKIKGVLNLNRILMMMYTILALWPLILYSKSKHALYFYIFNILFFLIPAAFFSSTVKILSRLPLNSKRAQAHTVIGLLLQIAYFGICFAGTVKALMTRDNSFGNPLFLMTFAAGNLGMVVLCWVVTSRNFKMVEKHSDDVLTARQEWLLRRGNQNE